MLIKWLHIGKRNLNAGEGNVHREKDEKDGGQFKGDTDWTILLAPSFLWRYHGPQLPNTTFSTYFHPKATQTKPRTWSKMTEQWKHRVSTSSLQCQCIMFDTIHLKNDLKTFLIFNFQQISPLVFIITKKHFGKCTAELLWDFSGSRTQSASGLLPRQALR